MNVNEVFEAGRLAEAAAIAAEDVKEHPDDADRRVVFAGLLCFEGNLERADFQLDALEHLDPQAAATVASFHRLVRAEQARREFFDAGRPPEFLDQPPPRLQCHLEASIRLREGHPREAAELLQEAQRQCPSIAGTADGRAFAELRDVDDLTSSFFEVLTNTGQYLWVPIERVERIELPPPTQPHELLWRRARMAVRDGPDGEVFLPALYAGSHAETDDRLRLGRRTEWRGGKGGPVQGIGRRVLLIGGQIQSIMDIEDITLIT